MLGIRPALFLSLALLVAPAAHAQYLEEYFAATSPGSWARYEVKTTDAKGKSETTTQTVSRLDDEGGNVVIDIHIPAAGKKGKESSFQIHARPSFRDEKNPLNFMAHVARMIFQSEGEKAREMPIELMQQMTGGATQFFDYSQNVKRVGEESIDGRAATHYQASGQIRMKIIFKELVYDYASELWLSADIPFGRVKETTEMKDSKGKLRSTSEMTLAESGGSGATSHISGPIEKFEMPALPGR